MFCYPDMEVTVTNAEKRARSRRLGLKEYRLKDIGWDNDVKGSCRLNGRTPSHQDEISPIKPNPHNPVNSVKPTQSQPDRTNQFGQSGRLS